MKRAIEISKDTESSGGLKVQLRERVGVDSVFDYQGVAKFAVEMCLDQGLIAEAKHLYEEHLGQFREAN